MLLLLYFCELAYILQLKAACQQQYSAGGINEGCSHNYASFTCCFLVATVMLWGFAVIINNATQGPWLPGTCVLLGCYQDSPNLA